ncbi:MAG: magnesium transporter CorA family protein [Candidatus Limnocylindrales bacterium]|jgi:magnesium transporter
MPKQASLEAGDPAEAAQAESAHANGPVIRVVSLDGGVFRDLEGGAALAELERAVGLRQARVWVDLGEATPGQLADVGHILGLHPLLIEDLAERDQRAKLEQMGEILHLVVFSLGFDGGTIYDRELDFVLGQRFLLSSHSRWWDSRATRHLREGVEEAMRRGPDHLLWALCDDTIDAYFPMLDRLGDEIDAVEDEVVASADRALLERLFELKRELILIRRVTAPEREMFNVLSSREEMPVSAENRLYYRDAYDHLIRLTDELDTYRELASATLEAYLSTVNNNLSLIMKRLTGVTVVVAGIGAVAGIFGMSEAQAAFRAGEGPGFWIVTFAGLLLAALAAAILHKIDWI